MAPSRTMSLPSASTQSPEHPARKWDPVSGTIRCAIKRRERQLRFHRSVRRSSISSGKPAQVALAWVLGLLHVTAPIVGASKTHHLDDAVGALRIQLDPETRAYLEEPYAPKKVTGHSSVTRMGSFQVTAGGVLPLAECVLDAKISKALSAHATFAQLCYKRGVGPARGGNCQA